MAVEPELDALSRIAAGDDAALRDGERYDGMAMALHWLTALLVFSLFGLSQTWDFPARGSGIRHAMQHLHVSLGISLALVLVVRIAWRGFFGRRYPRSGSGPVEAAARFMHYLLYLLLTGIVLAGLGKLWSRGTAPSFFGLADLPVVAVPASWRSALDTLHEWGAWTLMSLVLLHAAAALYHHYGRRDGIMKRMLPSRRRRVAAH